MRRAVTLLAVASTLVAVIALSACASTGTPSTTPASTALEANATVTRDIDGDTIAVHVGGHDEHVRLIGIDTPETVSPTKPVMCFGKEASNETARLLPPGTAIRLVRDAEAR